MSSLHTPVLTAVETSITDGPDDTEYQKGSHSTGEGDRYEERVLALVFLRCLRRGLLFRLSANNSDAGKFDDLVLEWRPKENTEAHTLLVQVKHKTSPNAMTIEKETWLSEGRKSKFGLRKYSTSYKEISETLDTDRVTCVLLTNASQGDSYQDLFQSEKVASVPGAELLLAGGDLYRLKPDNEEVSKAVSGNTSFLEHFYALCKQRNSEEIMGDICEELEELLGAGDLCEYIGNRLCERIREWMNKESVCLTRAWSKWQALVDEYVRNQLTQCRVVTTRLKYRSVADVWAYVESCNPDPAWVRPPERETEALSATKVHQALAVQTHIVVDVKWFTELKHQILRCWGPFCRWLVIVDDDSEGSRVILDNLLKQIKNERRLVIVSSRENNNCFTDEYNPCDVSDESWEELLDMSVALNGEHYKCCMRDLVAGVGTLKSLLGGQPALLLALARLSRPLRMGKELQAPPKYYVPRKLVDWRSVTDQFFSSLRDWDVCVTDSVSYQSFKYIIGIHSVASCDMESWFLPALEFECPLILLNDDPKNTEEKYRTRQRFEIYIVRKVSGGRWKVHHYSELPRGVEEYAEDQVRQLLKISDTTSNVIIVEGRPGVGKSTLLSDVAKQIKEMDSTYWLLRLNLREFYSELKQSKESGSAESAVDSMLKTTAFNENELGSLECALLRYSLLASPRVICLVDGFDEVCPDYVDVCREVLRLLKPQSGKLVVTTRPAVVRILEDQEAVSAHSLEPFSLSELEQFFAYHPSTVKIPPVSILHKRLRDLLRIPLFAEMFAVVSQSGSEMHDVVHLYDAFFESKFTRYHKDTLGDNISAPGKMEQIKNDRDWHEKQLMLLAASVLLRSTRIPEEPSFKSEYFVKAGIVFEFTGEKPAFLHKTFAEHFLAKWCFHGAEDPNRAAAYREAYLDASLGFFRESFDRRAVRGRPLLEALLPALLGGDVGNVAALLDIGFDVTDTDACGRNALHLAAGYDDERALPLLRRMCRRAGLAALSAKDRLLGWTPMRYAAERGHCDSVEELVAAGSDISHLGDLGAGPHDATQLQEVFQRGGYLPLYQHVFQANHGAGEVEAVPQGTMPQMEFAVSVISANMDIEALSSIIEKAKEEGHIQVFHILSTSHNRRRIKPILAEAS